MNDNDSKVHFANFLTLVIIFGGIGGIVYLGTIADSLFKKGSKSISANVPKSKGNSNEKKRMQSKSMQSNPSSNEVNETMGQLTDKGTISEINPELNEVYVKVSTWDTLNTTHKENVARMAALFCKYQKGEKSSWAVIKDAITGRIIAEYSEDGGLQME